MTTNRFWTVSIAVATALVLSAMPVRAQTVTMPVACSFDTAAHTDVLNLEFSLRAYRGKDTLPDMYLTSDIGGMMRARFAPPPSIGALLYPNSYRRDRSGRGFTSVFGTIQFDLTPQGAARDVKWFAESLDQPTDDALEKALQAALATDDAKLLGTPGAKEAQHIRVQFLATSDTATHAPLFRMKVPMLRIDSGGAPVQRSGGAPVLVPRDQVVVASRERSEFEFMIDPTGIPVKESIQIIAAPSLSVARDALTWLMGQTWQPFYVGGCPVPARFRTVTGG